MNKLDEDAVSHVYKVALLSKDIRQLHSLYFLSHFERRLLELLKKVAGTMELKEM